MDGADLRVALRAFASLIGLENPRARVEGEPGGHGVSAAAILLALELAQAQMNARPTPVGPGPPVGNLPESAHPTTTLMDLEQLGAATDERSEVPTAAAVRAREAPAGRELFSVRLPL